MLPFVNLSNTDISKIYLTWWIRRFYTDLLSWFYIQHVYPYPRLDNIYKPIFNIKFQVPVCYTTHPKYLRELYSFTQWSTVNPTSPLINYDVNGFYSWLMNEITFPNEVLMLMSKHNTKATLTMMKQEIFLPLNYHAACKREMKKKTYRQRVKSWPVLKSPLSSIISLVLAYVLYFTMSLFFMQSLSMYNFQELGTEAISWTRRMIWERMILNLETKHKHTSNSEPRPNTTLHTFVTMNTFYLFTDSNEFEFWILWTKKVKYGAS